MQVSEQDLNYLRAQMNSLRAAASRGSVSSAQVFTLTDPVMDMITRGSISAAQAAVKPLERVRHNKRGTTYEVIGTGKMQSEHWWERNPNRGQATFGECDQLVDMREVVIYRSESDGILWVRPVEEFNDGRFSALSAVEPMTDTIETPVAWLDDGSVRAGSDRTSFRVVTAATKAAMPDASAVNFTTPLYTRTKENADGKAIPRND